MFDKHEKPTQGVNALASLLKHEWRLKKSFITFSSGHCGLLQRRYKSWSERDLKKYL
jgi:hypothetical protein